MQVVPSATLAVVHVPFDVLHAATWQAFDGVLHAVQPEGPQP